MSNGYAEIRTRPIRIAFLIPYGDTRSFLTAIETCSFLWGGCFNPIIPLFDRIPRSFASHLKEHIRNPEYLNKYFETYAPDYFVSLGGVETPEEINNVPQLNLKDIWTGFEWSNAPHYGIGLFEILNHLVDNEYKYVSRFAKSLSVLNYVDDYSLFLASVFGKWPEQVTRIFNDGYDSFFDSKTSDCGIRNFPIFFHTSHSFPRRVTSYGLDRANSRQCILFLDASRFMDITQYWNLRALGHNVIPVPKQAINSEYLNTFVRTVIDQNYREGPYPSGGNITVYESSSVHGVHSAAEDYFADLEIPFGLPVRNGEINPNKVSFSYLPLIGDWAFTNDFNPYAPTPNLAVEKVTFGDSEKILMKLPAPDFAASIPKRVVYATDIQLKINHGTNLSAEVIPEGSNLLALSMDGFDFARFRFRGGGITYLPTFVDETLQVKLPTADDVFSRWFQNSEYRVRISPAGKIASQMLKCLGGVWGTWIIADEDMFDLLHQDFRKEGRPKSVKAGQLIPRLNQIAKNRVGVFKRSGTGLLQKLIKSSVVQVGLELNCSFCNQPNWYALGHVDYLVECANCLESFEFPAHSPNKQSKWAYRTIGPFSPAASDYGSYSVLLTLRFFSIIFDLRTTPALGLEVSHKDDNLLFEIDLAMFTQPALSPGKPDLIFAECKTYRSEFSEKDVETMSRLHDWFPDSFFVFSTLEKNLTARERRLIRKFNKKLNHRQTRPAQSKLMVLTGTELYSGKAPPDCWSGKPEIDLNTAHAKVLNKGLVSLCELTQAIHLGSDKQPRLRNG